MDCAGTGVAVVASKMSRHKSTNCRCGATGDDGGSTGQIVFVCCLLFAFLLRAGFAFADQMMHRGKRMTAPVLENDKEKNMTKREILKETELFVLTWTNLYLDTDRIDGAL